MTRIVEGELEAQGVRVALVVSRFNDSVTARLRQGAEECLEHHGCTSDQRTVFRVPGSWELPQAARKALSLGQYDAVVALGALIRGETAHFDVLAAEVSRGLAQVGSESGRPVIFGILTTDTIEQALDRAGGKLGNKGWDAALAALEMVSLFRRMG